MHIVELRLVTPSLRRTFNFYRGMLGLPALTSTAESVTLQIGTSRLTFTEVTSGVHGSYHVAFNIPENQLTTAKQWLAQRVPLLRDATGSDTFDFVNWNAHSVYFDDPFGNILELIARHDLHNASVQPFDVEYMLNISEIGIAADDVKTQVAAIQAQVQAPLYRAPSSDAFSPLGDEHGLFIVVRRGRDWFPTTGRPAEHMPIGVVVVDDGLRPAVTFNFQ
ncbi:MAG: hypothetical protein NVSMB42_26770 [Herpetosiphon sp.]